MVKRIGLIGYTLNVLGSGKTGHAIVILGYMKATDLSDHKKYNYIMVADGWNKVERYINYSKVDFIDSAATYFVLN